MANLTKREAAGRLFDGDLMIPYDSTLFTDDYPDEWFEHWSFKCAEEYLECHPDGRLDEESGLYYTEIPMWSIWFQTNSFVHSFISDHENEVADLGFTLIYHDDELWGLGIDGAGYDFYENHWIPLYELLGLTWHEHDWSWFIPR